MKPLTIEINGTGTHNRGAELMAIAISDHLRATFPGIRLVVPQQFGLASDRHKYGFLTTWEFTGHRSLVNTVQTMLLRDRTDIISPAQVDIVLDASGFAFSDQWGWRSSKKLLSRMSRFYRKSQPLLLLPQALGPFRRADVAHWCKKLFARAELICARDRQSLAYVKQLGDFGALRSYPDFTGSVMAVLPQEVVLPEKFAAIVPNSRMLDKTGAEGAYPDFLRHALQAMRRRDILPVFILHDAQEDHRVLKLLEEEYQDIQVLTHSDPRVLKGMLGKAKFVIGSRFHALVSSMSQGIPCIGAGWSHKYSELFADFECSEFLMADLSDLTLLDSLVEQLSSEQTRSPVVARIVQAADVQKLKTQSMWEEVDALIRALLNQRK